MRLSLSITVLVAAAHLACSNPPPPPADSSDTDASETGVAVCGLTAGRASPGACAAAPVALSAEICRCGSRYYWDGTACAATAACTCTANCDLLYPTQAECETAYAACRDGGR